MSDLNDLFDLGHKHALAEEKIDDAVIRASGAIPDEPDGWPFHDISYDWYDVSFELSGVTVGWEPPSLQAYWDIGFDRCWIRYADGMERFAWCKEPTVLHPAKPSGEHHRTYDADKIVKIKAEQEKLERCRQALSDYIGLQGHDRCWYQLTLFAKLCTILGMDRSLTGPTISRAEFEAGCRAFQDEEYGPHSPEDAHAE